MKKILETLKRFTAESRSAVAIIMAVALVPLMLLIGIAVDFTFLSQSRTQTAFASQAAATQAIRIAAATYSLEVTHGTVSTTAAQRAITAANAAGNLWFPAELGNLIRSTLKSYNTATSYDGGTTGAVNTAAPPNFSAQITDTASYPPIFDPLFGSTKNWVYSSGATATTQFSYAEIVMLLDTSGSMLIGAGQSDIDIMEAGTVCPQQGYVISPDGNVAGGNALNYPYGGTLGEITNFATISGGYVYDDGKTGNKGDNDQVLFSGVGGPTGVEFKQLATSYKNTGKSDTYYTGNCVTGSTNYGIYPSKVDGLGGTTAPTTASAPCALACHFATATAPNGLPADYYGLARAEGVTLRIDAVFNATEQVIQDMETSQAVAGQLAVGVYQFNADVGPIVTGSTGSGGSTPEATTDLATALSNVKSIDYKQTPTETFIPQLINGTTTFSAGSFPTSSNTNGTTPTASTGGDTDLSTSIQDLEAGNAFSTSASGKLQPLQASGSGNVATSPQKFLFIVTDGMADVGQNGAALSEGEMTSISGEKAGTGTCSYIKNTLGFTVYILYVTYYPLANGAYYGSPTPGPRPTNAATNGDFSGDANASVQTLTEVPSQALTSTTRFSGSPTALALQACASTTNGVSDFYQATSASDIQTALAQMLKAALASTIRLTN